MHGVAHRHCVRGGSTILHRLLCTTRGHTTTTARSVWAERDVPLAHRWRCCRLMGPLGRLVRQRLWRLVWLWLWRLVWLWLRRLVWLWLWLWWLWLLRGHESLELSWVEPTDRLQVSLRVNVAG